MGRHVSIRQGRYFALRHVEEARRLSEEVGGADSDVKAYFFGLGGGALKAVLEAYGRRYGQAKRKYAEEVLPLWRAGQRQMSGLVAERLFDLLPPLMPLEVKYDLVGKLWERFSPTSHGRIVIGPDCDPEAASAQVERHLLGAVNESRIPDDLARRFAWLSAGDVEVHQALLNHFLAEERALIVSDARNRTEIILKHLGDHGHRTERIRQGYRVGKHTLEIVFDPRTRGHEGAGSNAAAIVPEFKSESPPSRDINPWEVLLAFLVGVLMAWMMGR